MLSRRQQARRWFRGGSAPHPWSGVSSSSENTSPTPDGPAGERAPPDELGL
ncbi:hypothetical protein WMF04_39980 [Sorangium sp. So ce260]|uniref:hypothetical protein n=1 Tax=Sorangium sp. So ce260 TaxID=3133291 RepID=UPI003F61EB42